MCGCVCRERPDIKIVSAQVMEGDVIPVPTRRPPPAPVRPNPPPTSPPSSTSASQSPRVPVRKAPTRPPPVKKAPNSTSPQPAKTRDPNSTSPQPAKTRDPNSTPPQPAKTRDPNSTPPQPAKTRDPNSTPPQPARTGESHDGEESSPDGTAPVAPPRRTQGEKKKPPLNRSHTLPSKPAPPRRPTGERDTTQHKPGQASVQPRLWTGHSIVQSRDLPISEWEVLCTCVWTAAPPKPSPYRAITRPPAPKPYRPSEKVGCQQLQQLYSVTFSHRSLHHYQVILLRRKMVENHRQMLAVVFE